MFQNSPSAKQLITDDKTKKIFANNGPNYDEGQNGTTKVATALDVYK